MAHRSRSLASTYARFDQLEDSDDELDANRATARRRHKQKHGHEQLAAPKKAMLQSAGVLPMSVPQVAAGPKSMMKSLPDLNLSDMTEQQRSEFIDNYSNIFNKNRARASYRFPETLDEQQAICNEADRLRTQGNALFRSGEIMEAAKLYEQAVLKFADWYADSFATDEERALVHGVKIPAHLNLAACSFRLGNYGHAVVHCTQVLKQEATNSDAINAKAYFRRGSCNTELGHLDAALADLNHAIALSPDDGEIRKACNRLRERRSGYMADQKSMSKRMLNNVDRGDGHGSDGHTSSAIAAQSMEAISPEVVLGGPTYGPAIASHVPNVNKDDEARANQEYITTGSPGCSQVQGRVQNVLSHVDAQSRRPEKSQVSPPISTLECSFSLWSSAMLMQPLKAFLFCLAAAFVCVPLIQHMTSTQSQI